MSHEDLTPQEDSEWDRKLKLINSEIQKIKNKILRFDEIPNHQRESFLKHQGDQLKKLIATYELGMWDHNCKLIPITLEDLEYDPAILVWLTEGDVSSSLDFSSVGVAFRNAKFELKLAEILGSLNRESLEKNTHLYGAKGANLDVLKSLEETLLGFGHVYSFKVPDYTKIPASLYDSWKEGGCILDEAERIHDWAQGRKIILRSSAVFSEDSEGATGAGIYDSVILKKGAGVQEILIAMKQIYGSVNGHQAITYRVEHNIMEERMGLVVQEYIDVFDEERGTINTVVKNVPELMEIQYGDGTRPLLRKKETIEAISGGRSSDMFHYQIDLDSKSPNEIEWLSSTALLLEKHYGQPIQLEFVQKEEGEFRINQNYLVQARFLPKSFSEKKTVEFPNKEALFEGKAVGVFDVTLAVLSNSGDNRKDTGVVVFNSTKYFTMSERTAHSLPEAGGVITLKAARQYGGHVETLCAEKGLALVFSDEAPEVADSPMDIIKIQMGLREGVDKKYSDLGGYITLRLVSDGLVGRVYGVDRKE